jgi:site-specific recombinase XerD
MPSSSDHPCVGPEATKRFFEFFTVPIRNKNARMAYYQAIGQFLDWCERAGFSNLEDIEPIHVAAYIEQHPGSAATIKQHMAAVRMMFSWLTEKGILAINPARKSKRQNSLGPKARRRRSVLKKSRKCSIRLSISVKS